MTALAVRPVALHVPNRPITPAHPVAPLRRGRAIHLVDLENLMGTAAPAPGVTAQTWDSYRVFVQPGDHVVVATSHHAAFTAWFELPRTGIQLAVRSGPSGADYALLDALDLQHAAKRYDWLVIASGDGIFASTARRAQLLGMRTWQVSGIGRSSVPLTRACRLHSRLTLSPATRVLATPVAA